MASTVELGNLKLESVPEEFLTIWNASWFVTRQSLTDEEKAGLRIILSGFQNLLEPIAKSFGWLRTDVDTRIVEMVFNARETTRLMPKSQLNVGHIFHVFQALFTPPRPNVSETTGVKRFEDLEATVMAFEQSKFQDHTDYVDFFLQTAARYSRMWKDPAASFYAPYNAVINASMVGKSRMLVEAATKRGVFGFVMCLRAPEEADLYRPARTVSIADLLTCNINPASYDQALAFTQRSCALFMYCMKSLAEWLAAQVKPGDARGTAAARMSAEQRNQARDSLALGWSQVQQAPEFWEGAAHDMEAIKMPMGSSNLGHSKSKKVKRDAGAEAEKHVSSVRNGAFEKTKLRIMKSLKSLLGSVNESELHVLFVVDEASKLVEANTFAPFRRALRIFGTSKPYLNIFCTLTDTTSRVSNLSPAKELETSERASKVGVRLFPPSTLVQSLDAWWFAANKADVRFQKRALGKKAILNALRRMVIEGVKSGQAATFSLRDLLRGDLLQDFELMAMFGRPAFYSMLQYSQIPYPREALVQLLQAKLLKVSISDIPQTGLTDKAYLAVLGAIASIEVRAGSELASELASGHMRLVAAISNDRHSVYTLEISEPVLAMAAHHLLIDKVISWIDVMQKYHSAELNNSTMPGFRGEVAAQILLLMAWEKCLTGLPKSLRYEFPALPATKFLESLLGPIPWNQVPGLKDVLSKGLIRVNQFVKTFVEPSAEMLLEYFVRASGIYCRENQKGVDMVISMFFPEEGKDWKSACVSKERMAALLIQIRLRKQYMTESTKIDWESKVAELNMFQGSTSTDALSKDLPSVGLLLELRSTVGSPAVEVASKRKRLVQEPVEIKRTEFGYVLMKKGMSVEDVMPGIPGVEDAFNRLLESSIDPSDTHAVDASEREQIRTMFRVQPYMTSPQ